MLIRAEVRTQPLCILVVCVFLVLIPTSLLVVNLNIFNFFILVFRVNLCLRKVVPDGGVFSIQ